MKSSGSMLALSDILFLFILCHCTSSNNKIEVPEVCTLADAFHWTTVFVVPNLSTCASRLENINFDIICNPKKAIDLFKNI